MPGVKARALARSCFWKGLGTRSFNIKVQLDFHMSSQFAGVAVALDKKIYEKANINVNIEPICPPGEEVWNVLELQKKYPDSLVVGTAEQNIIVPQIIDEKAPVRAISAMFGRTPLAISCTKEYVGDVSHLRSRPNEVSLRIGTHGDTVNLMQKIYPRSTVIAVPREEKLKMLLNGELDAVQIYDVMETLKLQRELGYRPDVILLDSIPNVELGYAQVVFTPNSALMDARSSSQLREFLDATYEGWNLAIRDPQEAAKTVLTMQESGSLTGHWADTSEFTMDTVQLCNEYVKAGRRGEMLGTINPQTWMKANNWLLGKELPLEETLNEEVWKVEKNRMIGYDVARPLLDELQEKASIIQQSLNGIKPSLLVLTIGSEPLGESHQMGKRRLEVYSPKFHSWFSKVDTGEFLGVDVKQVNLPTTITQSELEAEIRSHHNMDAIQLMYPLPDHIDLQRALSSMKEDQCVDNWNYNGSSSGDMPLTPSAVFRMLEFYGVEVAGKRVTVIGRGKLVGAPLVTALMDRDATVSLAHSKTTRYDLENMCAESDIIISCVGKPRLVNPKWLKDSAIAISVGSYFDQTKEMLCGDFVPLNEEDKSLSRLKLYADSPGGIGPLVVAELFERVIKKAEKSAGISHTEAPSK